MGRPRRGEEKHRPINFALRMSATEKRALQDEAHRRDMPISDIIHEALALYWEARK